jgi:hypothetical protein
LVTRVVQRHHLSEKRRVELHQAALEPMPDYLAAPRGPCSCQEDVMLTVIKLGISAAMICVRSDVVIKHSTPLLGSMIASLPIVALTTVVWMYYGGRGP